ncbi:WxL domain-containing protein [Enterococcus sp. LJL120]
MKTKKVIVGLATLLLLVSGLAIGRVLQKTEVTEAADPQADSQSAQITFKTDAAYPFEDGQLEKVVTVTEEALKTFDLPIFKWNNSQSLFGWQVNSMTYGDGENQEVKNSLEKDKIYKTQDLLRAGFYAGDQAVFTAVYKEQKAAGTTDVFESNYGPKTRMPSLSTAATTPKINTVMLYSHNGSQYSLEAEYSLNATGLRSALYDIYLKDDKDLDYVIFTGGAISSIPASIGNDNTNVTGINDVTFYSLGGRAKSITLTGTMADEVNETPARARPNSLTTSNQNGTARLSFGGNLEFNTDIEMRNIDVSSIPTYSANGHSLTIGNGFWSQAATTVYGGTNRSADLQIQKDAQVTIISTGLYDWNIYGGSNTGSVTGDTTVVIANASGTIAKISGGGNKGSVSGDTRLIINNGAVITKIYGGTEAGIVSGKTNTRIWCKDTSSALSFNQIYGASLSGHNKDDVTTFVGGYGKWIRGAGDYGYYGVDDNKFVGGSSTGTIARNIDNKSDKLAVTNIVDTSNFSSGWAQGMGLNRISGTMIANVTNTIRAGVLQNRTSDNAAGAFINFDGGGNSEAVRYTSAILGASGNSNYDNDDFAEGRRALAESAKNGNNFYRVYGDLDTHLLGGVMSNAVDYYGYCRGAGWGGYYEGNSTITSGIRRKDQTRVGGYNFVTGRRAYRQYGIVADDTLKFQSSTSQGSASSQRTHDGSYGFDIVGGGGTPPTLWAYFQQGNSKTVHNNVLARWTYGGSFSGVNQGDTSIHNYGGMVDTLEGAGYDGQRIYGNAYANMSNGEVNFFFSGGGWADDHIYGDVYAHCTGGYINCPLGGTFGWDGTHTVHGNANVTISGGDLSGVMYPSHVDGDDRTKKISGGASKAGKIYGDCTLTLDLREDSNFTLPDNVSISAGRPYEPYAGQVGKDSNNQSTVTLNIYTSPGNNKLNNAKIYGDGGGNADSSFVEQININIDAPGSSINNIYATQYNNLNGIGVNSSLRRDVNINVLRAKTIGGLSGTSAATNDYLTNSRAQASTNLGKEIDVRLGVELGQSTGYNCDYNVTIDEVHKENQEQLKKNANVDPYAINFTGLGLVNFHNLEIANGFKALVSGDNAKVANGRSATAANHYNTYDDFGDVVVRDDSGFGIQNDTANALISVGKMTLEGQTAVYSPPGTGKINLTSLTVADDETELVWHKQGGDLSSRRVTSNGNFFGPSSAYQVLTFTSDPIVENMAGSLTPFNFSGVEEATGKTFVGDADTTTGKTTSANTNKEWGIMIPGSVIDFKVEGDYGPDDLNAEVEKLLSKGTGLISHDVTEAKITKDPPMFAYATQEAGVENGSVKGKLVIPILDGSNTIIPTLTFSPEDATGSWLRKGTIDSSKVDNTLDEIIDEQAVDDLRAGTNLYNPTEWTMDMTKDPEANQYSYDVTIVFSAESILTGRHVILTNEQAKQVLSNEDVFAEQEIVGRPLLTHSLTAEQLQQIGNGLGKDELKKVFPITYQVTNTLAEAPGEEFIRETWNVIIVPDGSKISTNKDFALFAEDTQIVLAAARNLANQAELDSYTKAVVIFADNSPNQSATMDPKFLEDVKNGPVLTGIPVTYTAKKLTGTDSEELNLTVEVTVMGSIYLSQVTDVFDFGSQTTSLNEQTHWPTLRGFTSEEDPNSQRGWSDIVVTDTRGDNQTWKLSVKEKDPLTSSDGKVDLEDTLYFQMPAIGDVDPIETPITPDFLPVISGSNGLHGSADYQESVTVTNGWGESSNKGIKLVVPFSQQIVGDYSGSLEWTIEFGPGNNR